MSKQSLLQSAGLKKSTTKNPKSTVPENKKEAPSKAANAASTVKPKAKAKAEVSSSSASKKRSKFFPALGKNKLSIGKYQSSLSFFAINFSLLLCRLY